MNKALLALLIILLQISAAGAAIEVMNADTVWTSATSSISQNFTDILDNTSQRIVVEYANVIYKSNLTNASPELISNAGLVRDRILIDHANAVFNPYLQAASVQFNASPRIIIRDANRMWNPELGLKGIAFVDIRNSAFDNSTITIPVNTTVIWINFDSASHTVAADDGSFNTGNLQTSQSFSRIFNASGTYQYRCSIHPSMTGIVVVTTSEQVANGNITGTVTNATSAQQEPNVNVTAGGVSVLTNAAGFYNISIAPGTYTVTASKEGFVTQSVPGVVVTAGETKMQNFALQPEAITNNGSVTRDISPSTITPGSNLTISLIPSPPTLFDSPGYQVIETIPQGFTFVSTTSAGYTTQGNVYTFTQINSTPITYILRAPSTNGGYTISGTFKDSSNSSGTVNGASTVIVSPLSPTVAPFDTSGDGRIQRDEAVDAVVRFFSGDPQVPRETAVAVVVAFFSSPV